VQGLDAGGTNDGKENAWSVPSESESVNERSTALRKFLLSLVAGLSLLGLTAQSALADNPHFVGQPTATLSGTSLLIQFKAAGLGTGDYADFTLTGDLTVFSRCFNRGGNKPQADNKQETVSVNEQGTFPVRGGQTTGSFSLTAQSTLDCPGNQIVVIQDVDFDLVLAGVGLQATLSS
jgi:hypothetical protein